MCTSLMGGLDHRIADIRQRVAIAFTPRSPIERLVEAKVARGWRDLPVLIGIPSYLLSDGFTAYEDACAATSTAAFTP